MAPHGTPVHTARQRRLGVAQASVPAGSEFAGTEACAITGPARRLLPDSERDVVVVEHDLEIVVVFHVKAHGVGCPADRRQGQGGFWGTKKPGYEAGLLA